MTELYMKPERTPEELEAFTSIPVTPSYAEIGAVARNAYSAAEGNPHLLLRTDDLRFAAHWGSSIWVKTKEGMRRANEVVSGIISETIGAEAYVTGHQSTHDEKGQHVTHLMVTILPV